MGALPQGPQLPITSGMWGWPRPCGCHPAGSWFLADPDLGVMSSCPRGALCTSSHAHGKFSTAAPSAQLRKAPRVVSRRLQCHQGGSWPRAVGRETLITAVSALCRPQFDSDVPLCSFLRVSSTCFSVSFLGLHFLSNLETFGQFLQILFCPFLPGPQLHTSGQWVCSRPLMPSHLAGPSSRAFFHLACAACKPTDLRLCGA